MASVRMSHSHHVDALQPGPPKSEIDFTFSSDEELDSTHSVGDGHDSKMLNISRCIGDEVDLEIDIRKRLATTIENRIRWAVQMLDVLSNVKEPQDQSLDADDFQDAALDAFEALEAPSAFIFDTGYSDEQCPPPSFSPTQSNQPAFQRVPKTRSSRTPKPSEKKKHLYIKLPSSASSSQLAVLVCPVCNRTQFTTLQGLLNHARLAHAIEWASHDACIAACAVPISADAHSREMYETDGVEVPWGGGVVGLRRLFERAVGVDDILSASPLAHVASDISSATAPSTLLSRTLGLHADSPALAHFLGRAPKRRCIHVYDEDQHVDVTNLDGASLQPGTSVLEAPAHPKGFRMRYPHRNTARKGLDFAADVHTRTGENINPGNASSPAITPSGTTASRFHITARIRLEDRSLLLKEDRRIQLGITDQYRWMLGVTAPSYSLPLSTFLTSITVMPPRTVSPLLLTAWQQPFAVIGTANEPFMAKVILQWVGGGKMEVEHWVELDQSRSYASVFGSEQLLDLELGRNIPLLPVPMGSPPPLPSLDRPPSSDSHEGTTLLADAGHRYFPATSEGLDYEQVLRDLLSKVPMTAKNVRPRMTVQVPYKLAASPAHLLALVPGRRKAIEWARARALHALYIEHMASISPCRRVALSVGDVYMFLEDGSHFPRPLRPTPRSFSEPKKKRREKDGVPILGEESCPSCGIKRRLHPGYDIKNEEDTAHWTCTVVPVVEQRCGQGFPLINLAKVLAWPNGLEEAIQDLAQPFAGSAPNQTMKLFLPPYRYAPRDILTTSPPDLILAVHKVVTKLRLPTFPDFAPSGENLTNGDVERCLTPAALLSATLKPFISILLRSAIEISKRDATSVVSGTKDGRGRRMKKLTFVLTPGHVLRGLRLQPLNSLRAVPNVTRTAVNCDPRLRESITMCLAQLGVRLDFGSGAPGTNGARHKATAKTELE